MRTSAPRNNANAVLYLYRLMVLDNADDREIWLGSGLRNNRLEPSSIPLIDYLPRCCEAQLLMTTRDRQLGHRLGEGKNQPLDVTRLAPREAQRLLSAKLNSDQELDPIDADELTRELEYLPLTITQGKLNICYFVDVQDAKQGINGVSCCRLLTFRSTSTAELAAHVLRNLSSAHCEVDRRVRAFARPLTISGSQQLLNSLSKNGMGIFSGLNADY